MALTKDKTWAVKSLYLPSATALNHNKNILYQLKRTMVEDFGWVVVGSSNSTAADSITPGSHYTDRWLSGASALVFTYTGSGTRAHSWIVLENTNIGSHFQICIDLDSNSAVNVGFNQFLVCSSTGQFSGGSTTARPTATDEVVTSSQGHLSDTADTGPRFIKAMQSSDGKCFRWLHGTVTPQTATTGLIIDTPKSAPSWWTEKWVTSQAAAATALQPGLRSPWMSSSTAGKLCAPINGAGNLRQVRASEESCYHYGMGGIAQVLPYTDYNGDCIADPVGLFIAASVQRGFLGTLYDAYWVNSNMVSGVPVPGTGAPWAWVKHGDILWGWDGSAPVWVERAYA